MDSYRNMTVKHLLWHRWVMDSCGAASYVVKSDDDQFVDTIQVDISMYTTSIYQYLPISTVQLPTYLSTFLPEPGSMWYLCQVLRGKTPHRDPASKVTEDEEILCSCKVT